MSLPQVRLDDRRFQDLVSEARLRIAQTCPEWTEHNVSDPGITLIELFAWMTDILIYRLNRIPDKLHLTLLELLGVDLYASMAAHTRVRFRATAPIEAPLEIPRGTEVGTVRTATEESIVFQVQEAFTVQAVRPATYIVERAGNFTPIAVVDGVARPQGPDCLPFGRPPQVGDALYLGFDDDISHLLMQVDIDASRARGTGVKPTDPPLRWEISQGDGIWEEAEVLADTTGGFNHGRGTVEVQCPGGAAAETVDGRRLRWLRCRIAARTRAGSTNSAYTHPPEIYSIGAVPVGALVAVEHAAGEVEESLGTSDGTPGQVFRLRFAPVLPLDQDETLEVRDPGSEHWHRWTRVDSFEASGPADRHFKVDLQGGELELGPALRQRHGGWTQYGQVPPHGAELRLSGYRHGGGARGNIAAGSLNVLRSAIPGIDHVINPKAASGGVDGEPIDSARRRAALELRTRYRAVTAEDYEFFAHEASSRVGRAICLPPASSGAPIEVRVLPRIQPADRLLTSEELTPDPWLLKAIGTYLDPRRVIGTTVHVLPVRLRAVSVVVNLQADPEARLRRVEEEVLQALYTYINPLCGGSASGPGDGWSFGRLLNQGELYQIVHSVEGVQFVKILRVYETDLHSGEQSAQPAGSHLELEPDELLASATHIVKATHPDI